MAQSVLCDAEVMGMGRTSRHFTGRVDLWSASLLDKIHECIYRQLLCVLMPTTTKPGIANDSAMSGLNPHSSTTLLDRDPTNAEEPLVKRMKTDIASHEGIAVTGTSTRGSGTNVPTPSQDPVVSIVRAGTVPIRIRLSSHGIRVQDDWLWDPKNPPHYDTMNAIIFAQQVGDDLNLPPEAVQAIAISITEQVWGLVLPPDPPQTELDDYSATVTTANSSTGPTSRGNPPTAAWVLDPRINAINMSHLVAHHRPPNLREAIVMPVTTGAAGSSSSSNNASSSGVLLTQSATTMNVTSK